MSQNEITYMSGNDLLKRTRQDRADFASLWNGLTESQMTQYPGPQHDWSVKDLIVHIIWWENYMVERIGKIVAGTDEATNLDLDEINAEILEDNKDRPLAEVLADFENNLAGVEALIISLTDEQINNADAVDYGGRQLLKFLMSDTFGHYAVHRPDLEAYVGQIKH